MSAAVKDGLVAAIGLMSGTSMDGIDAALIWTDGISAVRTGPALTVPYGGALRRRLQKVVAERGAEPKAREKIAREITLAHVEAVERLLAAIGIAADAIEVIGFHGHTVFHNPAERVTIQIGDAALLAERTGIGVVAQMRLADVKAGGQGAPLVPLYHAARASKLEKPVAVLNIGGVANVTWLGTNDRIVAYDCGPGNALIDDLVHAKTGRLYDASGTLSLSGKVDDALLATLLDHPYFDLSPPKSLDRNAFDASSAAALSAADGAATLAAFTVQSAARSLLKLGNPKQLLVCGGGRLNRGIMAGLAAALPETEVAPVEKVGWRGDALEAEAFGYLAVRSLKGLPLSLPSTTGVPQPMPGGEYTPAPGRQPVSLAAAS
jgi:anhydro-N-acetylmuramic acid kinase